MTDQDDILTGDSVSTLVKQRRKTEFMGNFSFKTLVSYPGQFALSELPEEAWNRIFPTSLTGGVTSEIAEDDRELGCQNP